MSDVRESGFWVQVLTVDPGNQMPHDGVGVGHRLNGCLSPVVGAVLGVPVGVDGTDGDECPGWNQGESWLALPGDLLGVHSRMISRFKSRAAPSSMATPSDFSHPGSSAMVLARQMAAMSHANA